MRRCIPPTILVASSFPSAAPPWICSPSATRPWWFSVLSGTQSMCGKRLECISRLPVVSVDLSFLGLRCASTTAAAASVPCLPAPFPAIPCKRYRHRSPPSRFFQNLSGSIPRPWVLAFPHACLISLWFHHSTHYEMLVRWYSCTIIAFCTSLLSPAIR